ncbi:MAG: GNAT family N-acetyltransferase [Acidimicrobiales bacterium]
MGDPATGDLRSGWVVVELHADETHALRRTVLRDHTAESDVDYPTDHWPGTFHLGVRDRRGRVVAVASFAVEPAPGHPDRHAVRLRGMAVDRAHQGAGLGTRIMDEAMRRLRDDGTALCWANARTTALAFYRQRGFEPVGDEFDSVGLTHIVVVLDLEQD